MIPETAILNEAGQVAMRYMKQANSYVRCNGNEYIFSMKANIAMSFVEPEDVPCMLGVRGGGCCSGGKKKNVIFFIDETHFRRWTNGGGR